MFKNKKVVVTGGSGFIGTHYIEELLNRGANVVTHTYESPLQTKDDRVEVIPNINLEKYDDTLKLIEGTAESKSKSKILNFRYPVSLMSILQGEPT